MQLKSMHFTFRFFLKTLKMKKYYELIISNHHEYVNNIATEVCGKIAVSSRKRAHGMQGIFIVPSQNSLTFTRNVESEP